MANNRTVRINGEIKRAISEILLFELKDPRLSEMITVTRVDTTKDLKYAKVYVSVYDEQEKKQLTIDTLKGAEGFIRSKVNGKIKLRRIPELLFILDDSIEYGVNMIKFIDDVNAEDKERVHAEQDY